MSRNNPISVSLVMVECSRIVDWASFHDEFDRLFGFPDFYGRNLNAWIDCMTSLDNPSDGMTSFRCEAGRVLTIELSHASEFMRRCPEQFEALVDSVAFVNWRRIEQGGSPVIALSYRV